MYQTKYNKSIRSMTAEYQFRSIIRTMGGKYLYEYSFMKHPHSGLAVVDFVVGISGKGQDEDFITINSMTGVELKTTIGDLRSGYGINFNSFRFNYLLVPADIAFSAIQFMKSKIEFNHVGILVIQEDGLLCMERSASVVRSDDEFSRDLRKDLSVIESFDSIAYLMAWSGQSDCQVPYYNAESDTLILK